MAGRGPAPKDPQRRARRNADVVGLRLVEVEPDKQPTLVEAVGGVNPRTLEPWQAATIRFWDQLGNFPTTQGLLATQWTLLAVAMISFDAVLRGDMKAMPEFRLQLAKFGIAPDDVARLRFQFAQADDAETRNKQRSENRAPRRVVAADL